MAVSGPVASPPVRHPPKPLLGLRGKPGRLALAVFRMPLRAYRYDAGWLLGRTFLLVVHIGRKTGQPHSTVAMVLRYDPGTHEAVICSAWGPNADWVRNLRAGPAVQVKLGRESYTPEHRFLSENESFEVAVQFRREHPWRLRLLSTLLGWGDLRDDDAASEFTRTHPFVALRPTAVPPT
jgi:deazaflavin-dependent oxidoreductase (nitroreductase family)